MTVQPLTPSSVRQWWHSGEWSSQMSAQDFAKPETTHAGLRDLACGVLSALPFPGSGQTAERFDALAAIGEINLNLGRVAEAHADALAILNEIVPGYPVPAESTWGVWAAEHPDGVVVARKVSSGDWVLNGTKMWCSGAGSNSHALLTARADDGSRLFAVDLRQSGARAVGEPWPTPALSGSDTRSVEFAASPAIAIGGPEDYLARPGFWHGAVGVAAVWLGGATPIARRLLDAGRTRGLAEVDLANLGAVDAALTAARATLTQAAHSFDNDPHDRSETAAVVARSARAVVEASVMTVLDRVGRALGPGPLAGDDEHWRRVGDLQLYLRQSHADRDLADLGRRLIENGSQW